MGGRFSEGEGKCILYLSTHTKDSYTPVHR